MKMKGRNNMKKFVVTLLTLTILIDGLLFSVAAEEPKPVIDAEKDSVYTEDKMLITDMAFTGNNGSAVENTNGGLIKVYYTWDDNNNYVYYEVTEENYTYKSGCADYLFYRNTTEQPMDGNSYYQVSGGGVVAYQMTGNFNGTTNNCEPGAIAKYIDGATGKIRRYEFSFPRDPQADGFIISPIADKIDWMYSHNAAARTIGGVVVKYEDSSTWKSNFMVATYGIEDAIAKIDAIDEEITLRSEAAILQARTAYNLLTAEQQTGVTNYQKLVDAEAALAALKEAIKNEGPVWLEDYRVEPGDYSIAVIPDIQELTANYPEKLNTLMRWIADNKKKENIQFAVDLGDVTWNGHQGGTIGATEFATAAKAFTILEQAEVDYSICYGNHDMRSGRNTDQLNQYFPLSKISQFKTFGGARVENKIDNTYFTFTVQGIKYMIVSLEMGPMVETMKWASEVIEAHPDHNVIIATHAYLDYDGNHLGLTPNAKTGNTGYGETMWNSFIKKYSNIFLVLSGHITNSDDPGSMAYSVDVGDNGNQVHQIMANAQDIDFTEQGVGMLLMLRFSEGGRTIDFNYFSPVNNGLAYKEVNQFSVTLPEGQLIVDENAVAAAAVDALIEQLPAEITTADEAAITEARTAYNVLTEEQQKLVKLLVKLEQAEADLVLAQQAQADKIAAKAVEEQIDALTGEDADAIAAARKAYDALTQTQKDLVTNLAKLEALENPIPPTPADPAYGDVNGDDAVDAKDALMILQAAVDKVTLTEEQTMIADVNGDKAIDAKDALLVLQKAVDKIDKFPVEA